MIGKKYLNHCQKYSLKEENNSCFNKIDFACCKNNSNKKASNYFVNEIESDIAGLYINFPNITYPAIEVLANTYVQKAYELNDK